MASELTISAGQHRLRCLSCGGRAANNPHYNKSFCLIDQANPQECNIKIENISPGKTERKQFPTEKRNAWKPESRRGLLLTTIQQHSGCMQSWSKPTFTEHTQISQRPHNPRSRPCFHGVRAGRDQGPST